MISRIDMKKKSYINYGDNIYIYIDIYIYTHTHIKEELFVKKKDKDIHKSFYNLNQLFFP